MTTQSSVTSHRRPVDPVANPFRGIYFAMLLMVPFWSALAVGINLLLARQ